MEKIILHSDLNNFFASVECVKNPMLKDECVVVTGDIKQRHGIVLAKNENAKKFGISTGETVLSALKKCPTAKLVCADMASYEKYSKLVRQIYLKYTDKIEPFGMDEAWLDVSGCTRLFGNKEEIANKIRTEVKETLGLTVSVGVSFNKIFAKLASDLKKPDAVTIISKENFKEKVFPLKADNMLYIGKSTSLTLHKYAIETIGDVANTPKEFLHSILGKWGYALHDFANGLDTSEVQYYINSPVPKSYGNSITAYRDLLTLKDVKIIIYSLSESVATRMRKKNAFGNVISLSLRDKNLKTFSKQVKISKYTNTTDQIASVAFDLFKENFNLNVPIRSMGVSVSNIIYDYCDQVSFYDDSQMIKNQKIDLALDKIRDKYGFFSTVRGIMMYDKHLSKQSCEPRICTLPRVT